MKPNFSSGSFNRRILRSLLAVSISIMVLLSGVYFFQQIEMALFFIRTDISGNLAYAGEKLNLTFHDAQNLYDEMMHNDDLYRDRKSTRLNSSHPTTSRMPSSA